MNTEKSGRRIAVPRLPTSRTVLLLVDVVNPFRFEGAAELAPRAVAAAQRAAALKQNLRDQGAVTIYANDNYGQWTADFNALWRGCRKLPGAPGRLARLFKPQAGDCTILKPRHSAFYATPLDLLLKQLHCRRLVIAGVAADQCVLFTAMDAYLRGFALWIPGDCIAAESEDAEVQALEQMRRTMKASIKPASVG